MCGIIGICSSEKMVGWQSRKGFLADGLYADGLRGMHSTGLMLVPSSSPADVIVFKKPMSSLDFLDLKTTAKLINDIDKYHFAIGHNRHATKGGITSLMAHPFQHGKITLVHNGTLFTQGYMPNGVSFTSDSECIANAFNEEDPSEIIPQLDGAFALVWHDNSDDTLHMVRNEERPLAFAYIKGKDTMLIASEAKMLNWLAHRNDMEIEKVFELGVGHELIFQNNNFKEYESKQHKLRKKHNNNYWSQGRYVQDTEDKDKDIRRLPKSNYPSKSNPGKIFMSPDKFNLAIGDTTTFNFDAFVPYNASNTRTAVGYLSCAVPGSALDHEVQIHGVMERDWKWLEGGLVDAKLTSVFKTFDSDQFTLIATTPIVSSKNTYEDDEEKKVHH